MNDADVRVEVELGDGRVELHHFDRTGRADIVALLNGLAPSRDVQIVMQRSDRTGSLLLAFDQRLAVLSLDVDGDLFEFVARAPAGLQADLLIGGQPTRPRPEIVVDLGQAITVVEAWLADDDPSSVGHWDRQ